MIRITLLIALLMAAPALANGPVEGDAPMDTGAALHRATVSPTALSSKAVVEPTSLDAIAKPLDEVAHATPPIHVDPPVAKGTSPVSISPPVAKGRAPMRGGH
jgi:hypothetical protein